MKIMVETSARHVHLTQEHLDILFGKGYALTPKKDLSQPGQFACVEKVEVVGPKGSLKMSIRTGPSGDADRDLQDGDPYSGHRCAAAHVRRSGGHAGLQDHRAEGRNHRR